MHNTLFNRTLEQLQDRDVLSAKRAIHKDKLLEKVCAILSGRSQQRRSRCHFSLLPERYFLNNSVDELSLHLQMIHQLLNQIQSSNPLERWLP